MTEARVEIVGSADSLKGAAGQATSALEGVKKSVGGLKQRMEAAYTGSKMLLGGLVALAGALGAGGLAAVRTAGQFEQTEVAFTTLLGSAELARQTLEELQEFAASTPFQFQGLADSTRLLITMGMEAGYATDAMKIIADAVAAAGGGQEELMGVSRALGQIQAKGKLSAEELMQLAERGIPAQQILQEQLGLTGEQVADIGNSGITAAEGIEALLKGLTERFAGAAEEQAQTIFGVWSTLKDNVNLTLIPLGETISDVFNIKELMQTAIGWLQSLRQALTEIRDVIETGGVRAAIERFIPPKTQAIIAGVTGAIVVGLIPALYGLARAFVTSMAPLTPFLVAGAALGTLAYVLYTQWKNFSVAWRDLIGGIGGAATAIFNKMRAGVGLAWEAMTQAIWSAINRILESVQPVVKFLPRSWQDAFNSMHQAVATKMRDSANEVDDLREMMQESETKMSLAVMQLKNSTWNAMTGFKEAFASGKESILDLVKGSNDLSNAGDNVKNSQNGMRDSMNAASDAIKRQGEEAEKTRQKLLGLADAARSAYEAAMRQAKAAVSQGLISIGEAQRWATSTLSGDQLKGLWEAHKQTYSQASASLQKTLFKNLYGVEPPALASGGIVTRPTLALLGEAGPEAVVPLGGGSGSRGGPMTVIIELDGRQVARASLPYIPGELARVGVRA